MKCEILKRTAIALFVGGIISASATAEDKSVEAAGSDFGKVIKAEITKQTEAVKTELTNSIAEKADKSAVSEALNKLQTEKASLEDVTKLSENVTEGFNSIQDKVHNLQEALVGDNTENNPGLIKSVSSAVEELNDNIAKKADQSAVDDINTELTARAEAIETLQKEKASLDDVTKLSENVKEGFDSIQDKVHNLQEALAGDGTDEKPGLIKSVSSAVEELNDNIAKKADKATVEQNTKEIEKIKNLKGYDSLTEVENKVKEGVSGKADKQALEDLKIEVKDNEEGIGELSKTVSDIDDNVVKLTDAHNELLKEHNNLVEDVKGFNDAYNKFTDATNTELDKKADIDDVEDALSRKANASDVYTKTESDSKLDVKADKTELAIKADKTELAIKADKTELVAKADKTELANKADKNSVYSKSETDNKFALKADNSVVSAQAADINNLRTDVNAHKVDIDKLRTDVNVHTKRLDHLDNRVNKLDKDLKRGLAAQAALTGLFQPYTVGKANFTAAVGGYKSQTAVAIGTGYRYNQNIATKAGVAFTQGGGVTYNAGVNFEW
ncbi:YadA-like family protein [Haemophilus seminalis]|uniref:YadA-like family protein n=2 Tax=Pasteurellaceae TaxID=712 RepID=UPI00207B640F|nr:MULTISPECIES: YadA-like family protein [Haemophilus]UJZ90279.1 YadA-like family protein [Haemophilus seminalis]